MRLFLSASLLPAFNNTVASRIMSHGFFIQGTKSQVWFKAVIIEGATWTRMLRCDAT